MPRITPVLWFDGEAEAAARFYVSLFPASRVVDVSRYPDDFPDPALAGRELVVDFELDGQPFQALNGGPGFTPNEAVSLSVPVGDQPEVDRLWDALAADGGQEGRCGWVRDRWGFWWQIVPSVMGETLGGSDPAGAGRAMQAMMGMGRLVVAELCAAYAGE
ncbi:putative 3-demethylubiquinone-9 3-methyltransferase (glyoxalase superfamily) [Frigoribacterium sp. PhB160]|uniref:VOC family protein n=1 Tax=Frigoribacterium sp. PhB160 TaxID=2485192 RepID=UPI000F46E928|nr:VOC family protein [Frigoribacterium sp. PhB160]ROS62528.1 putative 3-demethylubiquinone-9 3-methyltransferase (glyoxalase superfamily) [Frigoribacterium sp. PhB160]